MYWIDEGGAGVPVKLAKANMDGTESKILVRDFEKPMGLAMDYDKKVLYFSMQSKVSANFLEAVRVFFLHDSHIIESIDRICKC